MTTQINLEKCIQSYGPEILDALYSESTIIESTFDDFLKLSVNDNYKPSKESKINEIKTELTQPEINIGAEIVDLQFPIDDDDLYKQNIPSTR